MKIGFEIIKLVRLNLNKIETIVEIEMRTAASLSNGEKAKILRIDVSNPSARRILEYGFTPGQEIELLNKSPFNDPLAFAIRGTIIAVRKKEAESIIVE